MSEYPTHSDNIKDLIEYADQSMYETKQNGGNGVIIYQKKETPKD
jgi:GGDEF domain-containing protein